MKLSIRDFSLPDKSEIDIRRDGSWLMRLTVHNNKAKVHIENDTAVGVPAIEVGQVLQIKQSDVLIAEGEYRAE